ncbi:MAG: TetR family transcriptional regulator [Gammaproteobacteria bacterium]
MSIANRAVTDTQKQARRADILKVAMACFDELSYDVLTMERIAADADVAKGTLYLYFHSKEEVFLALYEQELERWFDELDAGLEKNSHNASFDSVVQLMSDSLADRPAFLRLIAILHTVLERNVDHATVRRFKTRLKERVLHTGALLEASLRFLKPGQGADLLLKINALVIGFQHLAEPSEVVEAVLKEPDLALFRVNLTEQLLGALRTLLMGLAYQAKYGNEK